MSKIFSRNFSEVCYGRFDAEYYRDANITITTYPLKSFVSIRSGKRIPKGETYSHTITPYKYLRVEDLDSESLEVDINNLKSIDENIFNLLSRYEIHNNEIALSIAGTIGKIFLFKNHTNNQVILTENCVKLQAINGVLPKFLSIVLKTSFLQNQMKRQYIQTTIPKLAIERIKELQIPQIPNKQIQQQIIDIMDNAYQVKKDKDQIAKEILDSTDKYLLDELGIVMPLKSNNILENRIFMRSFSDISNTRFDPNYHQKYYQDLEKALQCSSYPLVNLASTIEGFRKGIEVGSSEYSQSQEIPFIRVSDISNSGIDFDNVQKFISASLYENLKIFQPQENELLYSKDGTIGICLEADTSRDYVISGGILRLKLTQEVNRYFLQFLLASSMMNILASRQSIGAVIKHLNIDKFLNLKIPLPSLTEQERIADEIRQRQERAKKLQQEAKAILESAKKQVESMILGG